VYSQCRVISNCLGMIPAQPGISHIESGYAQIFLQDGGSRVRTLEGVRRRIYSLLHASADDRAPVPDRLPLPRSRWSTSRWWRQWRLTASLCDVASATIDTTNATSKAARTRERRSRTRSFVLRSGAGCPTTKGKGLHETNEPWWSHLWSHPSTFAYVRRYSNRFSYAGRGR
jgi:hypothetical protein